MKTKTSNIYLTAGLILFGLVAGLILLGTFWTPCDPSAMSVGGKFDPPSAAHLLGTDNFGRDIFSRVLQGAGSTFLIALATVTIGAVVGTVVGALTGYFGGIVDDTLMRLNDAMTAFPSILLALVIISLLGPGSKYNVVIALGLVFIPSFARVSRTAFAALRDVNYVKSARLMGASPARILVAYVTAGVVLTGIGLYQPFTEWAGAGATVPLTGFGHLLAKGVKKAVAESGWLGVLTGGLTATAGGITAAVVFAVLMALIFKAGNKR